MKNGLKRTVNGRHHIIHQIFDPDRFGIQLLIAVMIASLVTGGCLSQKGGTKKAVTASSQKEHALLEQSEEKALEDKAAENSESAGVSSPADVRRNIRLLESTPVSKRPVIPVLLYHHIFPKPTNFITTTPAVFDKQMKVLADNGYKTISLDQLYNHLTKGAPLPKKPVLITFDDGWKNQYRYAIPILLKYKFKAAFFVNPQTIRFNNPMFMNTTDLVDLDKHGFDVQSHTWAHSNLVIHRGETPAAYNARLIHELRDSKAWLEGLLKKRMYYFAYPYGFYNATVVKAVSNAGYKMAFTVNSGKNMEGEQFPLLLKRTVIFRNTSFKNYYDDLNSQALDVKKHVPEDGTLLTTDTVIIAAVLGDLKGVNVDTLKLKLDYHEIGGRFILSPDRKRVFTSGRAKLKPGYHYAVVRGKTTKGAIVQSTWAFYIKR